MNENKNFAGFIVFMGLAAAEVMATESIQQELHLKQSQLQINAHIIANNSEIYEHITNLSFINYPTRINTTFRTHL